MSSDALAPNLFVLGAILTICAAFPKRTPLARAAFVTVAAAATLRYLWWRWTDTVLPVEWRSVQGLFILGCFVFELTVLLDSVLGMIVLSRSVDRRAQADQGETWARSLPPTQLPSVDVFIPTYNEERDVLERTIVGAVSLDYPKFTVWVLDDGRRPWLAELAAAKGARYLTRADNKHAKAGNINAALHQTSADLIAVLDADFVARRNFLWRTVGLFGDPRVGCVQTPQYFFNKDPVQTNLGLGNRWADDQRLFFDVIMPSRDAWGAAFCCGTGFLMRRSALIAIGGISTGSICEDMLTSIELKRRGLETIYLKEELCIGLAPESVKAFFLQRMRWSRGQIQVLFIRNGTFGPALPLFYRCLLLPTYWAVQLPARVFYVVLPLLYLLSGLAPLLVRDYTALIGHLAPAIISSTGLIWWLARDCYFPILTDAASLFLAIKVAPSTLASIFKPFGVPFKVTPKGASAKDQRTDRVVSWACIGLLVATIGGMAWNAFDDWPVVEDRTSLALSTFWAVLNSVILGLTALIAREGPRYRTEERFALGTPARYALGAEATPCVVADLSLSGTFVRFGNHPAPQAGSTISLSFSDIGLVQGIVVRSRGNASGIRFFGLSSLARDAILKAAGGGETRETRRHRSAIRRRINIPAFCTVNDDGWWGCAIADASLSGALLAFRDAPRLKTGDRVMIEMPDVGFLSASVTRATANTLGIVFEDLSEDAKDNLIRMLYTQPRPIALTRAPEPATLLSMMAKRLFGPDLA
jgi:cellulose synthase/poly-beta-1,6-N-acetylglucosamine synthase-like glycosyltransferase